MTLNDHISSLEALVGSVTSAIADCRSGAGSTLTPEQDARLSKVESDFAAAVQSSQASPAFKNPSF